MPDVRNGSVKRIATPPTGSWASIHSLIRKLLIFRGAFESIILDKKVRLPLSLAKLTQARPEGPESFLLILCRDKSVERKWAK